MALRAPGQAWHGLSLCSGIGGLDLGVTAALPHARVVAHVEREAFCAGVLVARMEDGRLPAAPIWSDLATFDGRPWRGVVDFITEGYPCQPFSVAGKRRGEADPRHLWPRIARIVADIQPSIAFFENVPGHVRLGLRAVRADLLGLGYRVHAGLFSAAQCGAPHLRKRLFIFAAHPDRVRLRHPSRAPRAGHDGAPRRVADADSERQLQSLRAKPDQRRRACHGGGAHHAGPAESGLGVPDARIPIRLDRPWADGWEDGVPRVTTQATHRTDQLRALGNAVVPQAAALAFATLAAEAGLEL